MFILTVKIIWTINAALLPICAELNYPILDGCYNGQNKIYISETTSRPKDYILYHEIGHSLLNKDYFKGKLKAFPDIETMAWKFADYIYINKYDSDIKLIPKYAKIFHGKCPSKCVKEIINITIP